ncbi:hypothetical protein LCGC14_2985650, partial [marine sediment metagenome]
MWTTTHIGYYLLDSQSSRPGLHGNDGKGKTTLNKMNSGKAPFYSVNQQVVRIRGQNTELTIKIKTSRKEGGQSILAGADLFCDYTSKMMGMTIG